MARTVTLATLLSDLAAECDEAPFDTTSYVTKTQATRWLSQSVHAFSLTHRGFGILSKTTTFTTSSGTREYALPTDFAALRYLTYEYQGEPQPVLRRPLEEIELAARTNADAWGANTAIYCIEGEYFVVNDPKGTFTVTVRYVPELPMLNASDTPIADFSADTDKLLCKVAIDQWVVLDSAIKVARRNEKDPSLYIAARADIETALLEAVQERDTLHAPVVTNSWDRRTSGC